MAFTAGQRVRYRTTSPGGIWRDDWAGRTATVREDSRTSTTEVRWDAGPGIDSWNEDVRVITTNLELIEEETTANQSLTAGDRVRYKTSPTGDVYWDDSMSGELGTCIGISNLGSVRVDWDNRGTLGHYPQNIEKIPAAEPELPRVTSLGAAWHEGNVIQFMVEGTINSSDRLEVGCKYINLGELNEYLIDMVVDYDNHVTVTLQGEITEFQDCTVIVWDFDRYSGYMDQYELSSFGRDYRLISTS